MSAIELPALSAPKTDALLRGLGWFSIGLGLAELLTPRAVARASGMQGRERLLRSYGLREIAAGVGILAARDPRPYVRARVGGDALDLATLALGLRKRNPRLGYTTFAIAAVAGVTAADVYCASMLEKNPPARRRAREPVRDYHDRSGFPRGLEAVRSQARTPASANGTMASA